MAYSVQRSILAIGLLSVVAAVNANYEVTQSSIPGSSGGSNFTVHVYAPKSKGSFPVIFFMAGFGANAPVFGYSDLLTRLANKGHVVVGLDRLSFPNYPAEARQFVKTMTWAKNNLKAEMVQKKLTASPDLDRTTVMGQSSGNHIVGQALADSCGYAKAFVMIDPVDGVDPFGIIHTEDLITPGKKVNFSIPTLLLDNGLDPLGVKAFKQIACAPLSLGSPRWYNAWQGPIWHINATAYGHVDCLDDALIAVGGLVCPSNSTTDKPVYREHLAATSALFIESLFNHKPENFLHLEDSSYFSLDVVLEHDRKGLPDEKLVPGCANIPSNLEKTVVV